MQVSPDYQTLDPQDAARWQGLAILLGRLRTPDERARFAALYRKEAPDPSAHQALAGLLAAAAALTAREETAQGVPARGSRPMAHVA
jgi:hypothetical protein